MNEQMIFRIDDIEVKPLTRSNWMDFERLFGPRGAYAGCWCMWWRLTRMEFERGQGETNRQAMQAIVQSGRIPGLLAYSDGEPCGWCSVAPRTDFAGLERSRTLKRIDDREVWSIVCFFIDKHFRGRNLGLKMIRGAIEYVRSQGGKTIEAYPAVIKSPDAPPETTFMGIPRIFEKAGFRVVHQPSASRLIMRYEVE